MNMLTDMLTVSFRKGLFANLQRIVTGLAKNLPINIQYKQIMFKKVLRSENCSMILYYNELLYSSVLMFT